MNAKRQALVIGANGVRTQVRLSTDFPLIRSGGPRPQEVRSAGSGADWLWTIDRSATRPVSMT